MARVVYLQRRQFPKEELWVTYIVSACRGSMITLCALRFAPTWVCTESRRKSQSINCFLYENAHHHPPTHCLPERAIAITFLISTSTSRRQAKLRPRQARVCDECSSACSFLLYSYYFLKPTVCFTFAESPFRRGFQRQLHRQRKQVYKRRNMHVCPVRK
jgi:hypothetical protein